MVAKDGSIKEKGEGMKRSIKVLAGSLAAVLVLGSVLPVIDSHAGQRTEIIEDTFDNGSLLESYDSEIWSQYSESDPFRIKQLTKPTRALQFKGKNENGEATVLMTKDWYWEIHSLTFDLKIPRNASWFGLDFPDIIEPLDYVGDYQKQGEPMCYNSFKVGPEDDFGLTATQWTDWGFSSNKLSDTWVSVKIVPENENTGMIYLAPKGSAFPMSKGQKITLAEGQSFHNSNIVFIDYAFTGYMIDNVEIKTDMGVHQENFEDETDDLFELVTLHEGAQNFSMQIVEDGAIRKMSLSKAKAGEQLVANKEIKASDKYLDDDSEVLRTTFSLDMTNSKSDEELAFVFGIPNNGAEAFYDSWAYIISRAGGRLVRFNDKGKEVVKAEHFASFTSGTIGLTLQKDGSLEVLQNGSVVMRVSGVKNYQGYAGFAARTAIGKAIYIDDVLIENEIYHIVTTKTFSDDFKTNRLGTVGNSDYAYWAESGSINVTGGELTFDGCLDNTYFGSGYEYETYEMSFQLTSILGTDQESEMQNATYLDRWLGIDFGKQTSTAKTYGSYGMFLIRITPPVGEENWQYADIGIYKKEGTSTLTGEEYIEVEKIPASLFQDITYDEKSKQREDVSPKDAVCIKLVAEANEMQLYMKRASQKDYTLYGILKNVNPEGYAAIACTGWTYWTIDNFKMKNTAEIFQEAPEVVIEEQELVDYEERGLGVDDTYWAEEQRINAEQNRGMSVWGWIGIGTATVLIVGAATVIVLMRKKKKEAAD